MHYSIILVITIICCVFLVYYNTVEGFCDNATDIEVFDLNLFSNKCRPASDKPRKPCSDTQTYFSAYTMSGVKCGTLTGDDLDPDKCIIDSSNSDNYIITCPTRTPIVPPSTPAAIQPDTPSNLNPPINPTPRYNPNPPINPTPNPNPLLNPTPNPNHNPPLNPNYNYNPNPNVNSLPIPNPPITTTATEVYKPPNIPPSIPYTPPYTKPSTTDIGNVLPKQIIIPSFSIITQQQTPSSNSVQNAYGLKEDNVYGGSSTNTVDNSSTQNKSFGYNTTQSLYGSSEMINSTNQQYIPQQQDPAKSPSTSDGTFGQTSNTYKNIPFPYIPKFTAV